MRFNLDYKTSEWNKKPVVARIQRPSNPARARALGYKAKQGFVVARVRIKKGGRKRPLIRKGRKPKAAGHFFNPKQSKQAIAEKRVARKFLNLEVLNSYHVASDGKHHFYEVLLMDKNHAAVKKDKERSWITTQRRRVFRGKTSTARKSRGLRKK